MRIDREPRGRRALLIPCLLAFFCLPSATLRADSSPTLANALTLESGEERVRVIELFTSEGCSSCPPADAWLSGLMDDPGLWNSLIPVAFHVDYWDHIGWKDRFSDAAFTERQRRYASTLR